MRQLEITREYRHAHKVPFKHYQCSACGRLVGRFAVSCSCGADLR